VILVGVDPHRGTHTACAVDARTAELLGELTVPARTTGHERLVAWARRLSGEVVFALEDCRGVSGALERFLLGRGERVVRVPPRLMAGARRGGRRRGKSDAIDALAVARVALREPDLPVARLAGPEREIALVLAHREDLVGERSRIQQRLRQHLHDLAPGFRVPAGALDRPLWLGRCAERLERAEPGVQGRIAVELVHRCAELTARVRELERELGALVRAHAPELLAICGCGVLTSAKLVSEIAGVERFASAAKLAMHAGVAPIPASSGNRQRHRLNRHGNRQLNCALHRIAVTQGRLHEPARAFLARKEAEGKSRREALRCLKRHLANLVFRQLRSRSARPDAPATAMPALT
jgi:transposase